MNIVHFDDDDVLSIVMFTRSFQGNTTVKAKWLCNYKHSFLKLLFHSQLINVLKNIFQEISRHILSLMLLMMSLKEKTTQLVFIFLNCRQVLNSVKT